MEDIYEYRELLAYLTEEFKQLGNEYAELNQCFESEHRNIGKLDRIAELDAFRARLSNEVDSIQREEKRSEDVFHDLKPLSGILGFAMSGLIGKWLNANDPWSLGRKAFFGELAKEKPFGAVMIAFKKEGELKDIEVKAISRLAREANTTEREIISSLKQKGYSLATPEELWVLLDYLKERIEKEKN